MIHIDFDGVPIEEGYRFAVQINPGMLDGTGGKWRTVATTQTPVDGVRQCSNLLAALEAVLAPDKFKAGNENVLAPALRLYDLERGCTVVWCEDGRLCFDSVIAGDFEARIIPERRLD